MNFSSLKKAVLLPLIGVAAAIADPQLAMSTVSPEELSTKISQLNALRQNENLSDDEREQLDQLWRNAAAIEQMNDRCGSISLTEEMDEDCGRFYQYELPKFETEFFKVTGEIRLSPTRLSNAIEQRRNAINQCYEALQIDAFHPSRYLSLEGRYSPEPLTQGIEVSYDFRLEQNDYAIEQLHERIRQWNNVCGSIVLHSDNSGNLAPIFKDLILGSHDESKKVNGGLYFDLDKSGYGGTSIYVKSSKGIDGNYYLNGKQLFQHRIEPNEIIFEISINRGYAQIRLNQGNRWRSKVFYSDDDVENGLVGRFVWQTRKSSFFSGNKKSSANYAPSNTSYNNNVRHEEEHPAAVRQSSSRSGMDWAFQILGGLNLSMGEPTSKVQENYNFHAGENDSLNLVAPMVGAQFIIEFTRNVALGLGGGAAWHSMTYSDCDDIGCKDEEDIFKNKVSPMAQAELNFGDGLNGGFRYTHIFNKESPTFYLGGFVELINLVGIELGWVHAEKIWDNFYMGIYFRLPPRHFGENLNTK